VARPFRAVDAGQAASSRAAEQLVEAVALLIEAAVDRRRLDRERPRDPERAPQL